MHSRVEITADSESDGGGSDLISLDAIKLEFAISGSTEDALLQSRITRISKLFAETCNRTFGLASAIDTFTFDPGESSRIEQALGLALYPVIAIESVSMDGVAVDEDAYEIDPERGRIWLVGAAWSGKVIVTYTGGYALPDGAPATLQQLLIDELTDQRSGADRDSSLRSTEITQGDSHVGKTYFAAGAKQDGLSQGVADKLRRQFKRLSFA